MPRRYEHYGNKVTLRDICYEVIYQNNGKPLHVKDMTQRAKELKLFDIAGMTPPSNVFNTMASKMNQEITKGDKSRFIRTDENTFGLSCGEFSSNKPPLYEGQFRKRIEQQKNERREISAAAGEIQNKKSEVTNLKKVKLPNLSAGKKIKGTWPQLSEEEETLVSHIEALLTELPNRGFQWRLLATAALREHSVEKASAFLDSL